MHTISRIFAASLLAICIYGQSEPEPNFKGSRAPFEKVLRGKSDNICSDTFNYDNIRYFSDIIPGRCDTPEREAKVIFLLTFLALTYMSRR